MIRVEIREQKAGRSGLLFIATGPDGELVRGTRTPIFDACRALQAAGLSGPVEVWRKGKPHPDFRTTVEAGAKLTVKEGEGRPRIAPYSASGWLKDGEVEGGG